MASFPIRFRAVTEVPTTALGDPDIVRLIPLKVEDFCDLLCRFHRNRMLFGTTSEKDCDPQPIHAVLLRNAGN